MVSAALFIFYFIALLFIVFRTARKKIYPFSFGEVTAIFSFRILLGCIYGYIFLKYYHGDDTWNFFNDSLLEHSKLINHPNVFIHDFLPNEAVKSARSFGEGINFYLKNLEYWSMVKLLAVFNLLSGNNYYLDVLLFNAVTCWGSFLLFKVLITLLPDKKNILAICIFFIPSITFWLSGIRAEGLLLLFLALLLYCTGKWMKEKKVVYLISILLALLGFIIFRALYLVIFLPAYFGWILACKGRLKPAFYFVTIYSSCILIFLASLIISPHKNLASPLVTRQAQFFALHGNTRLPLDTLTMSPSSFIKILPQAFENSFIRPFIWEAKGALQWATSIEIFCFWILVGYFFVRFEKKQMPKHIQPFFLLFLFYGITQILIIGYIVPFPGAIVRYKVIPELFLIIYLTSTIRVNINYKNK